MSKKGGRIRAGIIKSRILKSDKTVNMKHEEDARFTEWLTPYFDLRGLSQMTDNSSILPQCIGAYKANIAGFGLGIRYKEDVTDTASLKEEFNRLSDIVSCLSVECDTKEVFEKVIETRETYGIAYVEVIRNGVGQVVRIEPAEDVPSIEKSIPLGNYMDAQFYCDGKSVVQKKKFRKYRQTSGTKTIYFKEFGDKRIMNMYTGEYSENVPLDSQANELLEFRVGSGAYGKVRWVGQTLGIDGSRKAEFLNNNYFENGRHTPLAIIVKGGTLTEDSRDNIREYADEIKGEKGQHGFLLLEAESIDEGIDFGSENNKKIDVELKSIADILPQDELFQNYLENTRKKVQSAFRLPDLYTGYTTDFNRATAQTAVKITEQQVFQPERKSLAWIINNKLLGEYGFEHVEVYFNEPDVSNPDDLCKILGVCADSGGLTPNKAKEIAYSALGETSDDYDGEWGNIPLAYQKTNVMTEPVLKADESGELLAVMKSVRALLKKTSSKGGG